MYKICFITTISMTLNAFVINLAKYIYETGEFEITFICNYDKEFEVSLPEYIKYIPVSMQRGVSISGFKATVELMKVFRENKFDIIQYSTPNASCYSAIAGFLTRIPVRLYCQWGIAYVGFTGIKREFFKLIEKMVCKLSTQVEPDSYSNLQFSHDEKLYPKYKGAVVWNGSAAGVDFNKFDINQKEKWRKEIRVKYEIPEDAFVYIFIGRITKDKGINELFKAYKLMNQEKNNRYLLLVGNCEITDDVNQELYKWSLIEEKVIYSGFTREVEKYIAASDVYVLPSYREGFGSSVIEAEAMGIPVIVTRIPGPVNAMQEGVTGLVINKKSEKELLEAMKFLDENSSIRKDMGSQAFWFVKNNFEQQKLFGKIVQDRKNLINDSIEEME